MKSHRLLTLAGAIVLGFVMAAPAHADDNTLRINDDDVRLRARPNEKAPTIMKLNDGQVVKLIERRGRWLRVQVRSKQGWIQRTFVEEDLRSSEEIVAARESVQDSRDRRSKTNRRRGDKGFDTLDEDARGEDGVSEMVEEDEDEDEDRPKKKKKRKASADDEDEEEEDADDEEEASADDEEDEFEDEEEPAPRKKKGKKLAKAGIREGATVSLKTKTPVRMKPSRKSDALFEASKGEEVEVIMINEDDPEFVRIQTEDGSKGWVPKNALAMAGGGGGDDEEMDDEESEDGESEDDENPIDDEDEDAEASVEKGGSFFNGMDFGVTASVGLITKAQTFASDGTDPVKANYKLGNNAPVIILGGGVEKPFGQYVAGAQFGYVRSIGGKGITIKDPSGAMDNEQVAWVTQQIDLRVNGGYWLADGKYLVGGGLGYHVGQVAVSGNMIADLPGERIAGFRVGGEFRAPKLTEKIGASAAVDALLGASMVQQAGLRDGTSAAVKAYYLALGGTYALKKHWDITAGYGLAYEKFKFSGESERNGPSVTSGRRKDLQHTIGAGIAYQF